MHGHRHRSRIRAAGAGGCAGGSRRRRAARSCGHCARATASRNSGSRPRPTWGPAISSGSSRAGSCSPACHPGADSRRRSTRATPSGGRSWHSSATPSPPHCRTRPISPGRAKPRAGAPCTRSPSPPTCSIARTGSFAWNRTSRACSARPGDPTLGALAGRSILVGLVRSRLAARGAGRRAGCLPPGAHPRAALRDAAVLRAEAWYRRADRALPGASPAFGTIGDRGRRSPSRPARRGRSCRCGSRARCRDCSSSGSRPNPSCGMRASASSTTSRPTPTPCANARRGPLK